MKKLLLVFATIMTAMALVYLPELFHSGKPVSKTSPVLGPDTTNKIVTEVVKAEPKQKKESEFQTASPARSSEKVKSKVFTLAQIKAKLNESALNGTWSTFQEIEQNLSQFPNDSENHELSQKVSILKKIAALKGIYCKNVNNQKGKTLGSKSSSEIQKIVFEQIQNCLVTGLLSDEQSNSVSSWLQNPICQ